MPKILKDNKQMVYGVTIVIVLCSFFDVNVEGVKNPDPDTDGECKATEEYEAAGWDKFCPGDSNKYLTGPNSDQYTGRSACYGLTKLALTTQHRAGDSSLMKTCRWVPNLTNL